MGASGQGWNISQSCWLVQHIAKSSGTLAEGGKEAQGSQ